MARTLRLTRGKRPTRAAKSTAIAINNIIARARSRPSAGTGVKKMRTKRVKNLKIKKLLSKPNLVKVKKGRVVVRTMIVRRKSHYPGNSRKFY